MNSFLQHYIIILPTTILLIGFLGILFWHKNFVLVILSLEICFVASNVGFVLSSIYLDDSLGFIFSLASLTLAGSEVSLGLALAILLYRKFDHIIKKKLDKLKS